MSNYPGDLFSDIELLKSLADESDQITMDRYLASDLKIETKPDQTPVTDADRAVETKIRALLTQERPNDLIIGEEFGTPSEIPTSTRYWVIDPIDGTKNFLRGVPIWATLIALVEKNRNEERVIAGIVSAPALFRRWYAALGFGAFTEVNGGPATQIAVSKVQKFADASFAFSDLTGWDQRRTKLIELMDRAWRIRGIGDFWSHLLVAEGAVDIAAEPKLALWDMAPLSIIVKEAGGQFSDLSGRIGPFGTSGVSSNGALHSEFLGAIS